MIRLQTYGVIKQGVLKIINFKLFKSEIGKFPDGNYILIIEKQYHKRSNPQNAYLWGVVYPIVKQGLIDAGFQEFRDDQDLEMTHELCKFRFLKTDLINTDGEVMEVIGSTRKLRTVEFMEYLDKIGQWAAEYLQVFIPEPDINYANAKDMS